LSAPRCRARTRFGRLPIVDGAFVGALGLEGEFAFGVAHGVVGGPGVAAALPAGGAGLQFEAGHFFLVSEGWAKA
jgi:hypothetical protein